MPGQTSPVLMRAWVRYWPTSNDAQQQAADMVQAHEALLSDIGDDVRDSASVQQATSASATSWTRAAWYEAEALKCGLGTKAGQSYSQLAMARMRFALDATQRARATATEIRERRAKDVQADGRELFGAQQRFGAGAPPEGPPGGSDSGPPNQPSSSPGTPPSHSTSGPPDPHPATNPKDP